jgi:hypothetical protein
MSLQLRLSGQNYYYPLTKQIVLRPDASLYARFHEEAHRQQHLSAPRLFIVVCVLRGIRVVSYFATLAVEYDAYRRARRVMRRLGLWSEEACQEAKNCLISYVTNGRTP